MSVIQGGGGWWGELAAGSEKFHKIPSPSEDSSVAYRVRFAVARTTLPSEDENNVSSLFSCIAVWSSYTYQDGFLTNPKGDNNEQNVGDDLGVTPPHDR